MRIADDIQAAIDAFEAQFRPEFVPPGTPDRTRLQAAANEDAHARACTPENIVRRLALIAERKTAVAAARRRATAARKARDPDEQTRRWLYRLLRKIGFSRDCRTPSGSAYYTAGEVRVRIADHDVPMTPERQYTVDNGGWSWATHGWTLDIRQSRCELLRNLVHIRREVRRRS